MTDRRRRDPLRDAIARAAHAPAGTFTQDDGSHVIVCRCGHRSVGRFAASNRARAAQLHRHHARREAELAPLYRSLLRQTY